ncbi:MAG: YjbH domain-containing protein [Alphaproteobacteria bacterium]
MGFGEHKRDRFNLFLKAGTSLTAAAFISGVPSKAKAVPLFFEDDAMAPSYSDWGDTGLLQMPNARMMSDGDFGVGTSYIDPYTRYFINIQALPWLQGVFRYTSIDGVSYSASHPDQDYKDKSLDLKIRLLKEREYFPETSVGLRDIGGTGLFQSEYFAFSKRYLNLDATLGFGFGNMGTREQISNPFKSLLGDSFGTRTRSSGTGTLSNSFFKGDKIGVFGGLEYQTFYKPIRLKLEYDSNDYASEPKSGLKSNSSVNYGVQYSPTEWLDITGAYERGDQFMLQASLKTNFNKIKPMPKFDEKPAPVLAVRNLGRIASRDDVETNLDKKLPAISKDDGSFTQNTRIEDDSKKAREPYYDKKVDDFFSVVESKGLEIQNVIFENKEIKIYVALAGEKIPTSGDMAYAADKILLSEMADGCNKVVFVAVNNSGDEAATSYSRSDIKRSTALTGSPIALAPALPAKWAANLINNNTSDNIEAISNQVLDSLEGQGITFSDIAVEGSKIEIEVVVYNNVNTSAYDLTVSQIDQKINSGVSDITFVEVTPEGKKVREINRSLTLKHNFVAVNNYNINGDDNVLQTGAVPRVETKKIAEKIFADLEKIDFEGINFEIKGKEATLYFSQNVFRNKAIAIGRAAKIVANNSPYDVELLSLVLVKKGLATTKTTIYRKDLEKAALNNISPEEMIINTSFKAVDFSDVQNSVSNDKVYPKIKYALEPKLRQHIGGGDNFYFWQVFGNLGSEVAFDRNWSVAGNLGINIFNNFDDMETKPSNSVLPHVRSDVSRYIKGNDIWIDNLSTSYVTNLAPNWYAGASAGIFEMMYAGVGGEILYFDELRDFGIGLDVNRVKQRDYSGVFEFLPYQTTTGHLSLYNKWPVYNIETTLSIGRYLAKDNGATLNVARNFESGVKLGVFATKTDVSAHEFGEGSFDKGVYVTIPLDFFTPKSTASVSSFSWRPLSRDGGQMLSRPKSLYDIVSDTSKDDITKDWNKVMK